MLNAFASACSDLQVLTTRRERVPKGSDKLRVPCITAIHLDHDLFTARCSRSNELLAGDLHIRHGNAGTVDFDADVRQGDSDLIKSQQTTRRAAEQMRDRGGKHADKQAGENPDWIRQPQGDACERAQSDDGPTDASKRPSHVWRGRDDDSRQHRQPNGEIYRRRISAVEGLQGRRPPSAGDQTRPDSPTEGQKTGEHIVDQQPASTLGRQRQDDQVDDPDQHERVQQLPQPGEGARCCGCNGRDRLIQRSWARRVPGQGRQPQNPTHKQQHIGWSPLEHSVSRRGEHTKQHEI